MPVAPFFFSASAEHEDKGRDKQSLAEIVTDVLEKLRKFCGEWMIWTACSHASARCSTATV